MGRRTMSSNSAKRPYWIAGNILHVIFSCTIHTIRTICTATETLDAHKQRHTSLTPYIIGTIIYQYNITYITIWRTHIATHWKLLGCERTIALPGSGCGVVEVLHVVQQSLRGTIPIGLQLFLSQCREIARLELRL